MAWLAMEKRHELVEHTSVALTPGQQEVHRRPSFFGNRTILRRSPARQRRTFPDFLHLRPVFQPMPPGARLRTRQRRRHWRIRLIVASMVRVRNWRLVAGPVATTNASRAYNLEQPLRFTARCEVGSKEL